MEAIYSLHNQNRLQILDLTVIGTRDGGEMAITLSTDLRIGLLLNHI